MLKFNFTFYVRNNLGIFFLFSRLQYILTAFLSNLTAVLDPSTLDVGRNIMTSVVQSVQTETSKRSDMPHQLFSGLLY